MAKAVVRALPERITVGVVEKHWVVDCAQLILASDRWSVWPLRWSQQGTAHSRRGAASVVWCS